MAKTLAGIAICLSMLAGVAISALDALNRTRCALQCIPPSDAMRWAGAILIIGPWILLAVYMRCKASLNG